MCTGELTDQFILTDRNVRPFWFEALPVWSTTLLSTFTINSEDLLSAWLIPAFTAGIGGGNWARIAEQRFNVMAYWGARVTNELLYPPSDETITATTATLKVTWPLYLLLAVQPLLALAMLIISTVLYTTPIAKGFGLVSVLSGVDKESLSLISGAGLSGELEQPTTLKVFVVHERDDKGKQVRRVQYRIGANSRTPEGVVKNAVYG
jgi:hypothetical protein